LPAGVLLLLAAGCSPTDPQRAERKTPPQQVETALVEMRTLTERLELTGSIEPTRVARMAAPVDRPVVACPVREGDRVHAGQLLARLGRAKGDDALAASARAEMEREETELGRIQKLVDTGALPGEELDNARVRMSEAQARHAQAIERLGDYRVSAPWSGVISNVHVAVGDFVAARAILVELFDPASFVLRFAVPEESAARVRLGAPIAATLDAYPGMTLAAEVTRVYPDIDRRTHTRTVEASIEGDVTLAPGMFVRLRLVLATVPEALTVPVESVVRRGGGPVVFVIASDGTAEQRLVELGMKGDGRVQVLSGVDPGESVAVAGHDHLRDGSRVRVPGKQADESGRARPGAADGRRKAR
jgi:membrane fusion protein (multidrug efflux system)